MRASVGVSVGGTSPDSDVREHPNSSSAMVTATKPAARVLRRLTWQQLSVLTALTSCSYVGDRRVGRPIVARGRVWVETGSKSEVRYKGPGVNRGQSCQQARRKPCERWSSVRSGEAQTGRSPCQVRAVGRNSCPPNIRPAYPPRCRHQGRGNLRIAPYHAVCLKIFPSALAQVSPAL